MVWHNDKFMQLRHALTWVASKARLRLFDPKVLTLRLFSPFDSKVFTFRLLFKPYSLNSWSTIETTNLNNPGNKRLTRMNNLI